MIRRTRILIFLALILSFSVLLSISVYYQVDTYRALSFPIEITEIRLVQNSTSGEFRRIEVDVHMSNPSFSLPLTFFWMDTQISLNGQGFRYGWGQKGSVRTLLPGGSNEFGFHFSLTEEDQPILQAAEGNGNWNWVLYMEPFIETGFLGRLETARIVFHSGILIV